jgi:hypothetical protein
MTETRLLFVGGGEVRIHEEMSTVRSRLTTENGGWVILERGGTRPNPICVNPANVAYLEAVEELEPALTPSA